ncbi:hypothetical protein [Azotobacter salinestris]
MACYVPDDEDGHQYRAVRQAFERGYRRRLHAINQALKFTPWHSVLQDAGNRP